MARRTYLPTLIQLANKLCRVMVYAIPIIKKLYPSNLALIAAAEAANAACATLLAEAEGQREIGD